MKNIVLALLLGLAALPLWAQSNATAAGADLDAERARLAEERKAISARYDDDRAACYKKFAVEGCLQESRQRRRVATDDIKRQEAEINDLERKRRSSSSMIRAAVRAPRRPMRSAKSR
jgi:Skp family chaperone for outer membrane proteins